MVPYSVADREEAKDVVYTGAKLRVLLFMTCVVGVGAVCVRGSKELHRAAWVGARTVTGDLEGGERNAPRILSLQS